MTNIPPLNYFMEVEKARAATSDFSLTLHNVFKEYKKVWNMYINLVKKCDDNNSKSFSKNKSKVRQNGGKYKRSENIYIDEENIANSVHSIEDVLGQCTFDLNSSMEESNESARSEKVRKDVPCSPIFQRNNSNSATSVFKSSNSANNSFKNIITDDNLSENNEQENTDRAHPVINASSTTNVSSIFLCSTPKRSQKYSKAKRQNVKRNVRSKKIMSPGSAKKKNNLVSIRKEKTKKVPLQIINNVTSEPKNIYQMAKNNGNKSYNIQMTLSPSSRKLKQTKLVFHETKRTMELSNNSKSPNVSPTTKVNKPTSDQDKILKQGTLTNNSYEKGRDNECSENTCDQIEVNKDVTENNFVYIQTNAEIKNEVLLQQEYEQINPQQINDPLNVNNSMDSTFFEENECNILANENNEETCESLMKSDSKSTNKNDENRDINLLKTEQNIVEIDDIEEPIKKKKLTTLENEKCKECKWNNKKRCSHHRNVPYKIRNITSSSTLLPDSSTT